MTNRPAERWERIYEEEHPADEAHLADFRPIGPGPDTEATPGSIARLEAHLREAHPGYLETADYGTDPLGAYGLHDTHMEAHYDATHPDDPKVN